MTNSKTTKRALLLSVLSILMCVAMLTGSTFAWFTDSVTSGKNKIVAGNLDVELLHTNGYVTEAAPVTAETKLFVAKDGKEIKWEPGVMVYENFTVQNVGTLALKFKLTVNASFNTVDGKTLKDVLKVAFLDQAVTGDRDAVKALEFKPLTTELNGNLKAGEQDKQFAIVIYWEPTANDNDYNFNNDRQTFEKLYAELGVTVVATQDTVETDSFDEYYDKYAEYPVVVSDATELKDALEQGKDVVLANDVVLTAPVTINGDVDVIGDGNSVISAQPVHVAKDANVNFKNVNFELPDNASNNASSVYASGLEGKVVFDGCTFTNPQWECIQITPKDGAEVIVTNCEFIVDGTRIYAQSEGTKVERMLHIQNTEATGKYTVVVTNNKFVGVDLCRNSVIDIDDIESFANVTCGGNTFFNHDGTAVDRLDDGQIYVNLNGRYDGANVATSTYEQFTQTTAAKLHH